MRQRDSSSNKKEPQIEVLKSAQVIGQREFELIIFPKAA
jgi:hypothetical protein